MIVNRREGEGWRVGRQTRLKERGWSRSRVERERDRQTETEREGRRTQEREGGRSGGW